MARSARVFLLAMLAFVFSMLVSAQEPQPQQAQVKINWQEGPTVGKLGDVAEIKVPDGFLFTGREGVKEVLRQTHNLADGKELGVLQSASENSHWLMFFEFDDEIGYVKDDEKNSLDADRLLKSLKQNTDDANGERSKHGWRALHVTGWDHTPYYDPQTHNLTWAIRVRGDDPVETGSVNHSIRILGRRGTMNVDLVVSPTEYTASTADFNQLISGFSYIQGQRYADFRAGDKVAKYGLTALIAGGAGAVLLKTGLLAKFWKLIVVGIAAIGGFIKKLFNSIFGSKETKIEDPNKQAAAQG